MRASSPPQQPVAAQKTGTTIEDDSAGSQAVRKRKKNTENPDADRYDHSGASDQIRKPNTAAAPSQKNHKHFTANRPEPLDISPEFELDEEWYMSHNLDLTFRKDGGFWESGLDHYVKHGKAEGRHPNRAEYNKSLAQPKKQQIAALELSEDFDDEWYLSHNQDVAASVKEIAAQLTLEHYLLQGKAEGRLPTRPAEKVAVMELAEKHNGAGFLNPTDLSVVPLPLNRIAFIGSCMMEGWGFHLQNPGDCSVDLLLMNNAETLPANPEETYDFLVIQIPLRTIINDNTLTSIVNETTEEVERIFDQTCDRMAFQLRARMQWNISNHLLTFVANFFTPQRNPLGILFPRYDLRNPEYFVDRLNQKLESLVRGFSNAYVLDIDRISASLGRRFCQDDSVVHFSHGALMAMPSRDDTRIEPLAPLTDHYEVKWHQDFLVTLWAELMAMYRVARQSGSVKLIVTDLDDTLWTGVSGDTSDISPLMIEGWPLGFAEALLYLKKRGVLLAIVSKNEEARIREIWPLIFGNLLTLDDFAMVKINWLPKAENMREILAKVNLLARNVVFIDDNPAERAAINATFPDMRILGRHPYYLRRTLLWSSETQVTGVTDEGRKRTDMIKAQVDREQSRQDMSREEFLASAAPRVTMLVVSSLDHPRFERCFELTNKTNQFNTTGKRWTIEECENFFQSGGIFYAFEVTDNFSQYGLVGVIFILQNIIEQWVMSCRVLGLEIEIAVMAVVAAALQNMGDGTAVGRLIKTDVNFPCRNLFSKCGFIQRGKDWILPEGANIPLPSHVIVQG